jgi:HK97 family phage portal protein
MSEYYKAVTIDQGGGSKAIVNIPAWAQAMIEGGSGQRDTINTVSAAIAFVPLVNRAMQLRADALASVPLYFTKLDGETEVEPPLEVDWRNLLWHTEASLCTEGANYIEKIPRIRSQKVGGLKWINPTTMSRPKLLRTEDGSIDYEFSQKDRPSVTWNLSSMIYMREFSLSDDVGPGNSPTKVAMNDAALIRYMSRFAARYFEGGAMPITLVSVEGLSDTDEIKRVEGFFNRAITGLRRAFRVLAVSRQIEAKVISQPLKDLAMPELNEQARHAVSLAFGIPQTMLEDAANFATSKEHRLSFWQDTVQPRGDRIAEQFNRQLLSKMGIQMHMAFEELDIFQEDENDRGATVELYTRAINTDPEAAAFVMEFMGVDLDDDQQKRLAALIADRKAKPEPTTTPAPPADPAAETVTETPPAKAAWTDDMGRWERKALRVLKESGNAVCTFDSETIPARLREKIDAGLADCKTADDVKHLFDIQPVTATKAPQYRDNPDTKALADSINALAAVYLKSQTPAQMPNISLTMSPITMTANLPDQPTPSVTFSPTIEAKAADQLAPQVIVNVPEQAAPVVNVETAAPVVNVETAAPVIQNDITVQPAEVKMPKLKRSKDTLKRDKNTGLATGKTTDYTYEENL